jgi:hypothetical protein
MTDWKEVEFDLEGMYNDLSPIYRKAPRVVKCEECSPYCLSHCKYCQNTKRAAIPMSMAFIYDLRQAILREISDE